MSISLPHALVFVGAVLSMIGAYAYVRDTLTGNTQPNRVSWSLWAVAPLIGIGAAISVGADIWTVFRTFLAGFCPLCVFIASFFNPNGYWRLTRFDFACGVLSCVALLTWLGADSPRLAILLAAIADCFAAIPTLRKAWRAPETETGSVYTMSLISTLLVIPSIPNWQIENCAFQIYLIMVDTALLLAVYRKWLWGILIKEA